MKFAEKRSEEKACCPENTFVDFAAAAEKKGKEQVGNVFENVRIALPLKPTTRL